MIRIIYTFVFCIWAINSYAWNAVGHKVLAQIAYNNLSPNAKRMCYKYLRSSRSNVPNELFLVSSIWLDKIKSKNMHRYDLMHYVDIPFSIDGTNGPSIKSMNAVSAIKNAVAILSSKNTKAKDKRLALRILIHVVGDVHQPLHAITRVSAQLPTGDLGGNLFPLGDNPVGKNLHQYWDSGAGYFLGHHNTKQIKYKARQLEHKWPCKGEDRNINPVTWAKMSHKLAIKYAYQLHPHDIPNNKYQEHVHILLQKQVSYGGCRLANLLNQLA